MKKHSLFTSAVIITNEQRNLFYLQQKDETYWIQDYRLKYCFFGGGIKSNENSLEALKRELLEELEKNSAEIINKSSKKLKDIYFKNIFEENCKFSLYEAVLPNEKLLEISKLPVKEGKGGDLIQRKDMLKIPFFTGIKKILEQYIKNLEN